MTSAYGTAPRASAAAGLLEHEQRGALAHHEPVAARVERSRRRIGVVVVAVRQGTDDVERPERERAQRHLHAPGDGRIDVAAPDRRECLADRDRARTRTSWRSRGSARGPRARCRGWRAPRRRRPRARGSAPRSGCRATGTARAAPRHRRCRPAPTRGRCRSAPGRRRRPAPGVQPGVGQGQLPGREAELAEPVELARGLRRHEVERVEVVDLGRDLRAERRRVEAVDALDGRSAAAQRPPGTRRGRSRSA